MEQRTIEGAWEEIIGRAEELTGHRVRVIVLDQPSSRAMARREPGPFLEDEATVAPIDPPRTGPADSRPCVWGPARQPDLVFGE